MAAGQVRIVGGLFRRTVLPVPEVRGLRPTPDRVRETLFNWLDQRIVGARCLDLFAGTGALGFESASRGAASVLINDSNRQARQAIAKVVGKLSDSTDQPTRNAAQTIELQSQEATVLMRQLKARQSSFDVIFLDPPFESELLVQIEPIVIDLLAPNGAIYIESDQPITEFAGLQTVRRKKSGQVYYHLLDTTANSDSA